MHANQGTIWLFGKTIAKNMGLTRMLNKPWSFICVSWVQSNEHKNMTDTYFTKSK